MRKLSSFLAVLVLATALMPASALGDENPFFAQLVAGSPWKGTWDAKGGWGKGTWELVFSLENGQLKARTQKVLSSSGTGQEGEARILKTTEHTVTLRTATGSTWELTLGKDGTLAGDGTTPGGKYGMRTVFTPSTR